MLHAYVEWCPLIELVFTIQFPYVRMNKSTLRLVIMCLSKILHLLIQVLTLVNPCIRFVSRQGIAVCVQVGSLIKGVAVSLKLFLNLLKKHGVDHPEEKIICQMLSTRQDATTRSKSFFLKPSTKLLKIEQCRATVESTRSLTCVCLYYLEVH